MPEKKTLSPSALLRKKLNNLPLRSTRGRPKGSGRVLVLRTADSRVKDFALGQQVAIDHLLAPLGVKPLIQALKVSKKNGGDENGWIFTPREAAEILLNSPLAKMVAETNLIENGGGRSLTLIAKVVQNNGFMTPKDRIAALLSSSEKEEETVEAEVVDAG